MCFCLGEVFLDFWNFLSKQGPEKMRLLAQPNLAAQTLRPLGGILREKSSPEALSREPRPAKMCIFAQFSLARARSYQVHGSAWSWRGSCATPPAAASSRRPRWPACAGALPGRLASMWALRAKPGTYDLDPRLLTVVGYQLLGVKSHIPNIHSGFGVFE